MKIRQKLLLEELLRSDTIKLEQLAGEFSVSVKTVRNDLGELESFLLGKLPTGRLAFTGNEVAFVGDKETRALAKSSLRLDDLYLYKLTAQERAVLILSELLYSSGYITIGELAEQLFVSRGTVNSDLQQVKSWCRKNNVQVEFKKSRGILIREEERRRRELFARLVQDFKVIGGIESDWLAGGLYSRLFDGVNMAAIKDTILEAEERFDFVLSDVAYEGLVVHIALSILRDREQGEQCFDTESCSTQTVQYRMAQFIVDQLNEQLDAGLNELSVYYITLHIYGRANEPQIQLENPEQIRARAIAERLIMGVTRRLNFDVYADCKLYRGLLLHISEAILRMRNRLTLTNPIKDVIIEEYRKIYEAVAAEGRLLTHVTGCVATPDELAYIVIHFASAMERGKHTAHNVYRPRIILVCATGEGTARLVQSQLNRYFTLEIIGVVPAHRLDTLPNRQSAQFIISTVPLHTTLPVVLVNPIIREGDITAIGRAIAELVPGGAAAEPPGEGSSLAAEVRRLAGRYRRLGEEEKLLRELQRLLEQRVNSKSERVRSYMLSEVLKDEYILLNQSARDWQQAVELGGQRLVDSGVVEATYVQAAIQNVKDLGPYIVLTKGVAIPHAGAEFGVHRTAISLVSLGEPVCFGNPDNDPVRYIFTLATTDTASHLHALKDLVRLLENQRFFDVIDHAANAAEVTAFIKEYEVAERKGY